MTMPTPKWLERVAALTLVGVLAGIVWLVILAPLVNAYVETGADLTEAQERLARYRHVAAQRPALEQRLAELLHHETDSGFHLSARTDALAAADLQRTATAVIERSGGALNSIQPLPVTTDGAFRRIAVRVQFTGATSTLFAAVYDLESRTPLLLIDNLEIRPRPAARTGGSEDAGLSIRFDLSGFMPQGVAG
jgi:general secretion pathway protein M